MWETTKEITGDIAAVLNAHRARITHVLSRIIIILAISLIAEVFVFNFQYFATSGNQTIDLSSQMEDQLPQDEDGNFLFTVANKSVTFDYLNKDVDNIVIDLTDDQSPTVVPFSIRFTDEAHSTYFEDNDYASGVPDVNVTSSVERSHYISLKATGLVSSLNIEVIDEDTTYPVKVKAIYLNGRYPFIFDGFRFGLVAVILALLYTFRPRSSLYKREILEHRKHARRLVVGVTMVEVLLLSGICLYGTNNVGVSTSWYNYGSWDGSSLVNVINTGGTNTQQYAELAKSLADGQLYLEIEPPEWLAEMDDPYDKGARDEMMKTTGDEVLWDVAYYNGHYYVYFGIVPCLIFYLPFYLLRGSNFPTAVGVLFACIMFLIGLTRLLWGFATRHFRRVSEGVFLLLQMPLVFCCGILYLLKFPTFYSLPIACGLAFSIWGILLWMNGREAEKPCKWYLGGSLCMALVLGCRPQLVLLSLVAFPMFWRRYITEGRLRTARGAREFACLLAPYAVVWAFICWYNFARFGSPFNFGANYNLTTNDMTLRGFNLGRLPSVLFAYLIQMPNVTGVFPFLQAVDFSTTYMGQTVREVTFGGIFACLPLLWAIFLIRPALKMRLQHHKTHTVAGSIVLMLVLGVVLCCLDGEAAGILQRYFADFSFLFLAAAVLIVFILNEGLDAWSREWLLMQRVLVVLVGVSLLYSFLLCLVPETGFVSDAYPSAYEGFMQTFRFWT